MQIRVFKEENTDAVIELWNRCDLTVSWNDPRLDIERKKMIQPELFLVGVCEDKIVASVMGGYEGHRGWLYYLAVDPGYRHRGFAKLIVADMEGRISKMGCPKINLMVRSGNTKVLDFYRGLGYCVDDVVSLGKRLVEDGVLAKTAEHDTD